MGRIPWLPHIAPSVRKAGETACPTQFANPWTARKVGQTVSSAGPPGSQFFTASQSQLSAGTGLLAKTVPAVTLGAMWQRLNTANSFRLWLAAMCDMARFFQGAP